MGKINILDASVANMIAAGEVVERPASVIKELVENSIDAGATIITVEIKNGGISYMRVTDNGRGIEQDDVGLAFVRHATSKIFEAKDLEAINTLGFRGEALCSIAVVSHVVLTSKTADAESATRVFVEGGEMEDIGEVGAPNGTTIEVKKLFYNTPARMKFLKKDTTEAGYITDIMQRFVLAHPEISFRYINAGKQVFISSGDGELINAIYTIYGKDYAKSVIPISYGDGVLNVSGYIGKSTISRPNRTYQSFFVNNRYVKSRTAVAALEEAYKNQLMGGKFPFAVINIGVNPEFVDVNVHPNKTEVKFSDEKKLFDVVYWGVKNTLYQKPIVPDVTIKEKREAYKSKEFLNDSAKFVQAFLSVDTKANVKNEINKPNIARKAEPITDEIKHDDIKKDNADIEKKIDLEEKHTLREEKTQYVTTKELIPQVYDVDECEKEKEANDIAERAYAKTNTLKQTCGEFDEYKDNYKIVGVLFDTYIILECGDRILIIDQHAAHERLKFEQLKSQRLNSNIEIQSLLAPSVVDLSAVESAYVYENIKEFSKLGFDIERFGENTVIINGAPAGTDYNDVKDLFIELIGQMMSDKKQIVSERDERAMYTIACKAAIKANKVLNTSEINALVKDVFSLDNINTCPHGRPIIISLTRYELEKQFKRIV